MSVEEYLMIIKKIPIKQRSIIKESKMYKIYLPREFDDLWEHIHTSSMRVDVIVFIPNIPERIKPPLLRFVDKIVMRNKTIVMEHDRFKIYLSSRYNELWSLIHNLRLKVDIILFIRN